MGIIAFFLAGCVILVLSIAFAVLTMRWSPVERSFYYLWNLKSKAEIIKPQKLIKTLIFFGDALRARSDKLDEQISKVDNVFFKEALTMLNEGVVDGGDLKDILESKVETIYRFKQREILTFKKIGKLPLIFGILGCLSSALWLTHHWIITGSTNFPGFEMSLSLSLYCPVFGFAISELLFVPLINTMVERANKLRNQNLLITLGVILVAEKTNPIILIEKLNARLPPNQRVYWADMLSHQMRLSA